MQAQPDTSPSPNPRFSILNPQFAAKRRIIESAADSLRFTIERCLTTWRGHPCATSSFVDMYGSVMGWHDFGHLEGPGWAANAVGGAGELLAWAEFTGEKRYRDAGLGLLRHVLSGGFIDPVSGLIRGYRHIPSDRFVLNYRSNDEWFCPGSMALIAVQMLRCSDLAPELAGWLRASAVGCAGWLDGHLRPLPNGWFPRRVRPDGAVHPRSPTGGNDPFMDTSGDGLFILQLWAELIRRGLMDRRQALHRGLRAFMDAGGFYASINHDTYDAHENVAYSVAFRTFRLAAEVLAEPSLAAYAHQRILPGLQRFKIREDRNGVATAGLLWMEESWDTCYLWENAEAAQAWFEAAVDTGRQEHIDDGLAVLEAMARHHYGPHGFLTEGVDWNNRVGREHHIDAALYGPIRYTEPLLNNQHLVEPTLYYLRHLAGGGDARSEK